MYEELQQSKRPKVPRTLRAKGFWGIMGVVSPSKYIMRKCALDQTRAEKKYFSEEWKYRLYKRMTTREEWKRIYSQYRREKHPPAGAGMGREAKQGN